MKMRAILMKNRNGKLIYTKIEKPLPGAHQILIKIAACGICRTDLHVVDGELKHSKLPRVPGHQVIGVMEALRYGRFTGSAVIVI